MNRGEQMETALKAIVKRVSQAIATDDAQFLTGALLHVKDVANAALALPRRNCDVGTAEEQMARFKDYCQHIIGRRCVEDAEWRQKTCTVCLNEWAQMPYTESEAAHG